MNNIKILAKNSNQVIKQYLTDNNFEFDTYNTLSDLNNIEGEYFLILGDEAQTLNLKFREIVNSFTSLNQNTLYLSILLNDEDGEFEMLNKRPLQTGEFEMLMSYFETYLTGSIISKTILNMFEFNSELKHLQEFEFIKKVVESENEVTVISKILVNTKTNKTDNSLREEVENELKRIFADTQKEGV